MLFTWACANSHGSLSVSSSCVHCPLCYSISVIVESADLLPHVYLSWMIVTSPSLPHHNQCLCHPHNCFLTIFHHHCHHPNVLLASPCVAPVVVPDAPLLLPMLPSHQLPCNATPPDCMVPQQSRRCPRGETLCRHCLGRWRPGMISIIFIQVLLLK
jgi:hypothetical protein